MSKLQFNIFFACAVAIACISATASAVDETPLVATISVDAARTLRMMEPRRLGGTNVAMWYFPAVFTSPQVRQWITELRPGYIRMPGGSWSNVVYWNGNGVRGPDGVVDTNKIGPDGYPAVDYSDYASSFLADPKSLHPASGNWHGHSDVRMLHEFINAIPGTEAMVCPNAGTGRAIDAAEWVKWANKKMSYNVRVWEIGNELGGAWEPGNDLPFGKGQITAEMYTKRYNDMADAMRAVDPTIQIGGGAFAEQMLRDCGQNVNFVSIHTYPGSITQTDAQMFADIGKGVQSQVQEAQKWIHQYQPQRENQIEIAYSEWNVGFSVSKSELFSGLWASIFLGELAKRGVDMAQEWDCFSDLLYVPEEGSYARKPEYYALYLWNNYMGDRLIPAKSSDPAIYTYASRSDDAVSVMLINTDHEREAKVTLELSGFNPAAAGEVARVTSREYYWNPQTNRPQWSTGPRIERLKTGSAFDVTLSPFSITYVRIPDQAKPGLSSIAQANAPSTRPTQADPELRFVLPAEVYAGDQVRVELIALAAGSDGPCTKALPPATLSTDGDVTFDRTQVRLAEAVGHFTMNAPSPGKLTLTAELGQAKATQTITVKPSIPRPVVFWDFSNPPVSDSETFTSDFPLVEDLNQRANRAVARVHLAEKELPTGDKGRGLLKVSKMPAEDKLKKENIRGVIFDLMVSPDFACEDENASVMVVMQSSANWWMPLGSIPLRDAKEWKTHQLDVKLQEHVKAMPALGGVFFIVNANKAPKGSIYLDRIGFMVR